MVATTALFCANTRLPSSNSRFTSSSDTEISLLMCALKSILKLVFLLPSRPGKQKV